MADLVDEETAKLELSRFAEYMGLDELDAEDLDTAKVKSVLKLIQRGSFTVDEEGKGTYAFARPAPAAFGRSVSFREPEGSNIVSGGKAQLQGGIANHVYTAGIMGQAPALVSMLKQKDYNAVTDVGLFCMLG